MLLLGLRVNRITLRNQRFPYVLQQHIDEDLTRSNRIWRAFSTSEFPYCYLRNQHIVKPNTSTLPSNLRGADKPTFLVRNRQKKNTLEAGSPRPL